MAITKTKVGDKIFFAPGVTGQEYSVTFDTNYPTTGGEALGFGSTTNFVGDLRFMLITKPFNNTNQNFVPQLIPSTAAASAAVKLYFLRSSTTNASKGAMVEVSNTTDCSAVSGRVIIAGY